MTVRRPTASIALWVAATAACGGGSRALTLATPPQDLVTRSAEARSDLTGTWARLMVLTAESDVPVAGTVTSVSRFWALVEITEAQGSVTAVATPCDASVETSTSLATTVLPGAFKAALPVVELRGQRVDAACADPPCPIVVFDRSWETLGVTDLALGAPLPVEATDPRVVDADGDGAPGVTVEVAGFSGGALHFVQRAWRELQATVETASWLDGTVAWGSERVVLDATSRVLRANRPQVPRLEAGASYFRSTRVPAETTCADVVAQADALFARP